MGFFSALPILGPILGDIGSTLLNNSNKNQAISSLTPYLNQMMNQYQLGYGTAFGQNGQPGMWGNLVSPQLQNLNAMQQFLYGANDNPGAFQNLNDLVNSQFTPGGLGNQFGGAANDIYGQNIPGVQNALSGIGNLIGPNSQLQNQSSIASTIFGGGGQTPTSQQALQDLFGLGENQTIPQMNLGNEGNMLLQSQGQTGNSQFLQNLMQSQLNPGGKWGSGFTPALQDIANNAQNLSGNNGIINAPMQQGLATGQGLLAANGLNPGVNGLYNTGAELQNAHGLTPTNATLQNIGVGLAAEPSLLPANEVASMARDQAGTAYSQNMKNAIAQAEARGNGAGSMVNNGLQNQDMASYADRGAQLQSQAMEKALLDQQALQLQQAAMGGQMAQGGLGSQSQFLNTGLGSTEGGIGGQNQFLNTGGNLVNPLSSLQSNNFLNALGAMGNAQSGATNVANVFGGLGNAGANQELQRLNLGGNLLGTDLTSQQQGLNGVNNLFGEQNQYALGAGGLANSGQGLQGNLLNSLLSGNLNTAQQGLNYTNEYNNMLQRGIGNQANMVGLANNIYNQNSGAYGNNLWNILNFGSQGANQGYNLANNMIALKYGLGGNGTGTNGFGGATNAWSGVLNNGMNALGGLNFGGNNGGGSSTYIPSPASNGGYAGSTNAGPGYNTGFNFTTP